MQLWRSLIDVVHNRKDKVGKDGRRAGVQVEANAKEDVPDDMFMDHGPCDAVDEVNHDIETQHDCAGVTDANELFAYKGRIQVN